MKRQKFLEGPGLKACFALAVYMVLLLNVQFLNAQSSTINVKGVMNDAMGPIIGASVVEKGNTANGTITDMDGNFSLSTRPDATLTVSYIGYKTQEVRVVDGKAINVTLKEDTEVLDEVVVVGFGTQKKVNLTGTVDVIDNKQLQERPVANAVQALQGVVPGLQITQGSGSLESRPSINVRGTATIGEGSSGSPLVLIDGMEADLNSINLQDIASISVLKDAAASSIYGSRAPFGVILVTTKAGGSEGKVCINYNNNFRFSTPVHMNNMMNSLDFVTWVNDTHINKGDNAYFEGTRFDRLVEYFYAKPYSQGVRMTDSGELVYALPEYNDNGQWKGGFSTGVDDVDWYDMLYKDWTFLKNTILAQTAAVRNSITTHPGVTSVRVAF